MHRLTILLLAGFVLLALAADARAASFSFQGLGDLPGGTVNGRTRGVSADGSVVVGYDRSTSGNEAFRWTSGGGMVGLGDLPGGFLHSRAYAVSADGSAVVGISSSTSGNEAFRWTSGGGMVGLGDLPGGAFDSEAYAVSADGSVVVGIGWSPSGNDAILWTSGGGMVSVRDLLVNHGVSNLTGWRLGWASGVSADGRTIVGTGINPFGGTEGWIATVPEPSTWALALWGALGLLIISRHWRSGRIRSSIDLCQQREYRSHEAA